MSEKIAIELTPPSAITSRSDTHPKLSTPFLRFCKEKLSPFNTFQNDHLFLYEPIAVGFNTWYF